MPTYRTSVLIDASPQVVWQLLSNVVAWPRWLPTVTSVEALDGPELLPQRRFRVVQPGLRPTTWSVSQLEANRRFEWRTASFGMSMRADHTVDRITPTRTSVLLRFEFRGVAGRVLGLLFGFTTRRYIEREAAALKSAAERGRGV